MGKCLIFNCQGEITNGNVDKLGYLKISIKSAPEQGSKLSALVHSSDPGAKMEIVGDSYFTNSNDKNLGKTIQIPAQDVIYIHNSDCVLYVDKYNLTRLETGSVVCPLDELRYSTNLDRLGAKCSGDIANLKDLTRLTFLAMSAAPVSGDIANLKGMTGLTYIDMPNTQVSGDVANLKDMTGLTALNLGNTQVSGDIANFKDMTRLTILNVFSQLKPMTGDIGQLSGISNCPSMSFKYSKLTGDLAILPSRCQFLSFSYDKGSTFTWTTRPSTAKIIAIEGNATIIDIDKMLQDQAQCQVGISSNDPGYLKEITVRGNRTSASDDAVATLQQKGYTVRITNV